MITIMNKTIFPLILVRLTTEDAILAPYNNRLSRILKIVCAHSTSKTFFIPKFCPEMSGLCVCDYRLDQTLGKPGTWYTSSDRDKQKMTIGARLARVENQV